MDSVEKPWGFEETQLALEEKRKGGSEKYIHPQAPKTKPACCPSSQEPAHCSVLRVTVGTWADGLVPHCVFLEWESWASGGGVGGQLASWGAREASPANSAKWGGGPVGGGGNGARWGGLVGMGGEPGWAQAGMGR